jgi:AcrR family transcriptional regulator
MLEAARRIFARKACFEASMGEIAREAGIDVGRFYDFFPSKAALFMEVSARSVQDFQNKADLPSLVDSPPEEELRALTYCLVRHFDENPSSLPLFIQTRSIIDWGLESMFQEQHGGYEAGRARLRRCMGRLVEGGRLRPMPLEFLTELYLDILHACLHFNHRHLDHQEVPGCVMRALDVFLHGVGDHP